MPFTYHPPTRTSCETCHQLNETEHSDPIIDSHNGKASSAKNFPFHNWYNFVLGYSPTFPEYVLNREGTNQNDFVVDPFMGSGTTLVCCKAHGIPSAGIDANDIMVESAQVKLNWELDVDRLKTMCGVLIEKIHAEIGTIDWSGNQTSATDSQLPLLNTSGKALPNYESFAEAHRPSMLPQKYISDRALAKATIIDKMIENTIQEPDAKRLFDFALTSIIVPISNVRYGPGFGVGAPKDDVDVVGMFAEKLNRMLSDLASVDEYQRSTSANPVLGDTRAMLHHLQRESATLMITSPPYPGDHEYTKHTRLELVFRGRASDQNEFRTIKRRMLSASTTNIYKDISDGDAVSGMESIESVTRLIQERLDHDGATSGFEKLYTRLVWDYFGGMHKSLQQCFDVLRSGGKIALLVSDSHAFKMVHIQTSAILGEIGERIGFSNPEIILWQLKSSTSHKYSLRENVLILSKP